MKLRRAHRRILVGLSAHMHHGLDLVRAGLAWRSTVYLHLDRLEMAGLVKSIHSSHVGDPRRYYWITDEGREALHAVLHPSATN